VAHTGRYAPSPTGDLHLGNARTALLAWLWARAAGGTFLLRVEDLDPPREVDGAAAMQLATLSAFGLESDETIVRQGQRDDLYRAALEQLLASGEAFVCHCSRADLAASGGVHRGCVSGAWRSDPSIRFAVPDGTTLTFDDAIQGRVTQQVDREVGDFVLRRADGFWAYQLAVVVDDAAQAITDVVRGADLLDSTPRQILLQRALGLPTPRYAHLPLVVDAQGRKLSKSLASLPIDAGDPLPALRAAWALLGQPSSLLAAETSLARLLHAAVDRFTPEAIPPEAQPVPAPTTSA
jgi:glutamyl-Q tRNA(Asp) synthetase